MLSETQIRQNLQMTRVVAVVLHSGFQLLDGPTRITAFEIAVLLVTCNLTSHDETYRIVLLRQ